MPARNDHRTVDPIDLAALTRRLHRIRALVPKHHDGHCLGSVTLSEHDFERLLAAMNDGVHESGTTTMDVAGVLVERGFHVARGEIQVAVVRPAMTTLKLVKLGC